MKRERLKRTDKGLQVCLWGNEGTEKIAETAKNRALFAARDGERIS